MEQPSSWNGVLRLADKLDSHKVLQVGMLGRRAGGQGCGLPCLLLRIDFHPVYSSNALPCSAHVMLSPTGALYVQACDIYIACCLAHRMATARKVHASPTAAVNHAGIEWMGCLLLADQLRMTRTAASCATPVMLQILGGGKAKEMVAQVAQLGQPASQVLLAMLVKGVQTCGYSTSVAANLPSSVDWQAPQNLF